MKIQISSKTRIAAPASKVWRILAHEFDRIGDWASTIHESKAIKESPALAGATMEGRVCATRGFGQVKEKFIYYDEPSMRFGYETVAGLPWFIRDARNHWVVQSAGADQSIVESKAEVDMPFFPGIFLFPLFRLQMRRINARFFEELKHYIEHDQPHPRKQKAHDNKKDR